MAKFEYKGVDVQNLITPGGSTVSGFDGLLYTPITSNYNSERPLPFNLEQGVTDISTLMTTKYVEFTAAGVAGSYPVPTDYNKIRAVVIGGGGGGAGGGGCGVSGSGQPQSRQSGGPGGQGRHGGFLFMSDVTLSSNNRTIQYLVGAAGTGGGGGQNTGNTGQVNAQSGQTGGVGNAGQYSTLVFQAASGPVQIQVPTSNVAPGGPGGPGSTTPAGATVNLGTNVIPHAVFAGNQLGNWAFDGDDTVVLISSINNFNYRGTSGYGYGGDGGGRQPNGDGYAGQDGTPGYIRIYLLRD